MRKTTSPFWGSADEKFDSTMRVNAVLQHTGDVLYVPPGIFKSICPFDIADFPFVSVSLIDAHRSLIERRSLVFWIRKTVRSSSDRGHSTIQVHIRSGCIGSCAFTFRSVLIQGSI